jgi:hypothetical protein
MPAAVLLEIGDQSFLKRLYMHLRGLIPKGTKDRTPSIKFAEIRERNFMTRLNMYMKGTFPGFSIAVHSEWSNLRNLETFRHCVAHAQGVLNEKA